MKVRSPLADMDVSIGSVRRLGTELKLTSAPGSSIDADITVPASEVLRILAKVLMSPSGLLFVLGLPYFCWQERRGSGSPHGAAESPRGRIDINKPW